MRCLLPTNPKRAALHKFLLMGIDSFTGPRGCLSPIPGVTMRRGIDVEGMNSPAPPSCPAMGAGHGARPTEGTAVISRNLRHFRVFLAVARERSASVAAERCKITQPAVTQALNKLDREAGGILFNRMRKGVFLTDRGHLLERRIRRAMDRLDTALAEVSPRLTLTATSVQLRALIAMTETQNFALAARTLGISAPSVHRAITQIEQEAKRPLFERTSFGMVATRPCHRLAQAARLAFAEFDLAETDLADFDGHEAGQIVIGALPLSRSVVLPAALARFQTLRPGHRVTIFDGPYDEMLAGLRRGDIDVIVGALRDPLPVKDVVQERLFADRLAFLSRPDHPLAGAHDISLDTLACHGWVVPRVGVPTRTQFDALFRDAGLPSPDSIMDCGSILLMRELLNRSDLLGCISAHQAEAEVAHGLVARLDTRFQSPARDIGLTYRADWVPATGQRLLLDLIRAVGHDVDAS